MTDTTQSTAAPQTVPVTGPVLQAPEAAVQAPEAAVQAPQSPPGDAGSQGGQDTPSGAQGGTAGAQTGLSDGQAVMDAYDYVIDGRSNKVPKAVIDQAAQALGLDPTDLLRGGQISKAGYEKLRTANEQIKKLEQFAGILKTDGPGALEALARSQGINPEEFQKSIESWLVSRYQHAALTPEQRRLAELDAREKQIQEYEDSLLKADNERRVSAQVEADRPRLEQEVAEAFKSVDFPHTPTFMRRCAEIMVPYVEAGVPITFKDAAQMVKQEVRSYTGSIQKELKSIDDVRRVFGDDLIQQIRKMDVDALRNGTGAKAQQAQPAPKAQARPEVRGGPKTMREADEAAEAAADAWFSQRR